MTYFPGLKKSQRNARNKRRNNQLAALRCGCIKKEYALWSAYEVLKELNIPENIFVFGRGCMRQNKGRGRKERYSISSSKISTDTVYVIQYCKAIEQFIVWNVINTPNRNIYTVIADSVPIVKGNEVKTTRKGIEFEWNVKEDVFTFSDSGIENFLNNYVAT